YMSSRRIASRSVVCSDCVALLLRALLFFSPIPLLFAFFFFNDTATTEIYTLSLHDALPISAPLPPAMRQISGQGRRRPLAACSRSEEHTSELQSLTNLVCRLLLEKKKKQQKQKPNTINPTSQTLAHNTSHHKLSTSPPYTTQ